MSLVGQPLKQSPLPACPFFSGCRLIAQAVDSHAARFDAFDAALRVRFTAVDALASSASPDVAPGIAMRRQSEALEAKSRALWRGPPTDQAMPCHDDGPGGL
jgi:hypothetical protein